MAYETLVAVFDTAAHADAAVRALKAGGFHESDISVLDAKRFAADKALATKPGLWNTLFGGDLHEHEANVYGQTVADGGVVLTLRTIDSEVAHAQGILNIHQPVDVHDRAVTAGIAPAAHVEAVERKLEAVAARSGADGRRCARARQGSARSAAPRRRAAAGRQGGR